MTFKVGDRVHWLVSNTLRLTADAVIRDIWPSQIEVNGDLSPIYFIELTRYYLDNRVLPQAGAIVPVDGRDLRLDTVGMLLDGAVE